MDVFVALADPVRRRIVEHLADGERPAGELVHAMDTEFGLMQPATSRHLRRLRESGLVRSRADGPRRLYSLDPDALREIDAWLDRFRLLWSSALTDLDAEIRHGGPPTRNEDT